MIVSLSTYLPPWAGTEGRRVCGSDEDAVTLAVAAGCGALEEGTAQVRSVVLVSRDLPLLEGGNSAALLAGLGLPSTLDVVERVGGAPATLDAVMNAAEGTLVLAADVENGAGAGAVLVGGEGATLTAARRVHRSLPLRVRGQDGVVHQDVDPRLQRERGLRVSLAAAELPGKPLLIAGLARREAAAFCPEPPPELPTRGASSPVFALAALADAKASGLVAAVEQATVSAATWEPTGVVLRRLEPEAQPRPKLKKGSQTEIKIAYTAYERAFDAKLRWQAGQCSACGLLAFPPRYRCLECGKEGEHPLVSLPRTGSVYTETTINAPVPGMETPYSLAVVELDGVDVRALVTVTDAPPGAAAIGTSGKLVFRRVATRAGVPDYGYAFSPERSR